MKQLQHVTTFSLIIALTGLSPMAAADSGRTSDDETIQPDRRPFDSPLSYHLSLEQMDGIHAGNQPTGCAEPTGRNNGERQGLMAHANRSGQPGSVNTTGRSGQYASVNSSRSGQNGSVNTGRR
jgi:hypothetical protein